MPVKVKISCRGGTEEKESETSLFSAEGVITAGTKCAWGESGRGEKCLPIGEN